MSGCRISKIKYKNGLEVICPVFSDRTDAERWLRQKVDDIEGQIKISGFALVAWDKDGRSMCGYHSGEFNVYDMPQFVADRLRSLRDEY